MSTIDVIKEARRARIAAERAYDEAVRAHAYDPARNAAFDAMLTAQARYDAACALWKPEDGTATGCEIHPLSLNPFCPNCRAHDEETQP